MSLTRRTVGVLGVIGLLVQGCGTDGGTATGSSAPSAGRVNAVTAAAKKAPEDPSDFCEITPMGGEALPFRFPALADGAAAPAGGTWRWVNLWATWCKPCVEEMPLLAEWPGKLASAKVNVDLILVSVDDTVEVVTSFRESHPKAPPTLRVADVDGVPDWLGSIGVDRDTPLPVHLFVNPKDEIRCIRAGGINASDYGAVKAVLTEKG